MLVTTSLWSARNRVPGGARVLPYRHRGDGRGEKLFAGTGTLRAGRAPRVVQCLQWYRSGEECRVARVVVSVMPKAEILDPQGQAIERALPRLGFDGVLSVRQGKRFELEVAETVDDETVARIAESLLANTVIEDWEVARVEVEA